MEEQRAAMHAYRWRVTEQSNLQVLGFPLDVNLDYYFTKYHMVGNFN